jgi:phage replication initiation protein
MGLGLVAWGGKGQKGWVHASLTGRACEWLSLDAAQEEFCALPEYEARRLDLALTTTDGSIKHETVLDAYRCGGFQTSSGGRPPSCRQILPETPEEGRTIYIGSRERDKFFRAYEKGFELARGLRDVEDLRIGGVPIADIYRLELELKAKTAPLPPDLIDRRDQYFAGAYPFTQSVLDVEPELLVMQRERGPQLDLARALANVQRQYGATLFTALVAHHGDIGAVWAKVVGSDHSRPLLEAGVLLVEHE